MWRCGQCGYIHDFDDAPDNCPKCGAPKQRFEKIEGEAAELIERSRYTNSLHMSLSALAMDMVDIAEDGIDDKLDPGCVHIFNYAREAGMIIHNMIDAELAGHMKKGKWG